VTDLIERLRQRELDLLEERRKLRDEVAELRADREREEWWEELLTHYDAPVTGIRDKHRNQELRRLLGLDAARGKL